MNRTKADLAKILETPLRELEQIAADPKSLHYRYERRLKKNKVREFRIPGPKLRLVLDKIKERLLDAMHTPPTMHGWTKRRSPKTYVKPHVRKSEFFNPDIKDFFPSVGGGRVCAFWIRSGFTPDAAKLLTSLTVCDNQLPQGSPTSQAIGKQILVRMDRRLNRLAQLTNANYAMYGDEFTISGRQRIKRLKGLALRIVDQEGFTVNPDKVKQASRSKKQEIAGIIVNRKPSLGRDEYRKLRATIHNCLKHGPESQNNHRVTNFEAHLRGRISHLRQINPRLGCQLLAKFNQIVWVES